MRNDDETSFNEVVSISWTFFELIFRGRAKKRHNFNLYPSMNVFYERYWITTK